MPVSNACTYFFAAPGAESVGQARVVSEFSKPFVLQGLFEEAPFSNTSVEDDAMVVIDDEGDVFYDAVEDMDDVQDG